MSFTAGLYCSKSDRLYPLSPDRYVCEETGKSLAVVYDYQQLAEALDGEGFATGEDDRTVDRFAPLLPFREARALEHLKLAETSVTEVDTPLDNPVFFKDETELSGRTTWARGSAVVRGLLDEWDIPLAICTNAGPSGLSLAHGLENGRTLVVVTSVDNREALKSFPRSTQGSVVDLGMDEMNERVLEVVETEGWMFGTPGWNPYVQEGLKTLALELFEQFEDVPASVHVAGLSNRPALAVKKGFVELKKIGWLDAVPKVASVTPTDAKEFVEVTEGSENVAAHGDLAEDRTFPAEALGGITTVSVSTEDLRTVRTELGPDHRLSDRPTGLLALTALTREGYSGGRAVLVGTGLGVASNDSENPRVEELDGTIDSLRRTLRDLL